jgi:hypothetical protein
MTLGIALPNQSAGGGHVVAGGEDARFKVL